MSQAMSAILKKKDRLNSFIVGKKRCFVTHPSFHVKTISKKEGVYRLEANYDPVLFKEDFFGTRAFFSMYEIWKDGKRQKYQYRFALPEWKFVITDLGTGANIVRNYEFRYEHHPETKNHQDPHMHVLQKVPPVFPSKRIHFEHFFHIVEVELKKSFEKGWGGFSRS